MGDEDDDEEKCEDMVVRAVLSEHPEKTPSARSVLPCLPLHGLSVPAAWSFRWCPAKKGERMFKKKKKKRTKEVRVEVREERRGFARVRERG